MPGSRARRRGATLAGLSAAILAVVEQLHEVTRQLATEHFVRSRADNGLQPVGHREPENYDSAQFVPLPRSSAICSHGLACAVRRDTKPASGRRKRSSRAALAAPSTS